MANAANKQEAFREGVKEFGRLVIIAAVSAAIVAAQNAAGLVTDPNLNALFVATLTFIGKAWDRMIHKDPTTKANGLLPF